MFAAPCKSSSGEYEEIKIIQVRTYTVAPDGRSTEIASTDPATKVTFRVTAHNNAYRLSKEA